MKSRPKGPILLSAAVVGGVAVFMRLYNAVVQRKLSSMFVELGKGNPDVAPTSLTGDFEHIFAGDNPLGGVRHTRVAMELWFARFYRLFVGICFTIKHVAANGPLWDTTGVIEWHDQATLTSGERYDNDGVHVVRLRWGKLASLHAYPDTAMVAAATRQMIEKGIDEASAPQIVD